MIDNSLLKYIIEIGIYVFSFLISSFAVRAIPFQKLMDYRRASESWMLYLLIVLVFTYCLGSLMIKILGIDLWIR